MHQDKSLSIDQICQSLKISRATFYRYLEKIVIRWRVWQL
ncbi:MAG: helix-turn-helix domain-containing protein [Gammaproteobacteria bacterium]|nr:helix-turn-helix domain-containing protein [Gammaproteobacteria bacterium]